MKKFLSIASLCLLLAACFETETNKSREQSQPSAPQELGIEDKKFSFSKETLAEGCTEESNILCTINMALKCTINPDFSECASHKGQMPDFIFMVDDSLGRPTEITYQVQKLKSLEGTAVEVYTNSQCDGNWFGLCNGNIIYVMDFQNNNWVVKDIYALAD